MVAKAIVSEKSILKKKWLIFFVFHAFCMNMNNSCIISVVCNADLILTSHVRSYCTVSQTNSQFKQGETVSLEELEINTNSEQVFLNTEYLKSVNILW